MVLISAFALFWLAGCKPAANPPTTVAKVDLQRYLGTWYEIARYPNKFEKDCVGVTATYTLKPNGKVRVENRARLKTLDGASKAAIGTAYVADTASGAKLKVSFFGPFYADYWIIGLGDAYDYAVVSDPSREYLWILSRTPTLPEATYATILANLKAQGFDTDKLYLTPQA
jgi:apolipoprotein D and lipocalin family protein